MTELQVYWQRDDEWQRVGLLAYKNKCAFFEYEPAFQKTKVELSPFYLPSKTTFHKGDPSLFDGLFGVFNDSLPDGWGRLLMDRHLRSQGIAPQSISPIERLAYVGNNGVGALAYRPNKIIPQAKTLVDLGQAATESKQILEGSTSSILDEILHLNGSSAGARPKVLVAFNHDFSICHAGVENIPDDMTAWIVKFPSSYDPADVGSIEYAYNLMAQDAGLEMPESRLIHVNQQSFFAVKRFDRQGAKRTHMHTACGLLNADHRLPSLDYADLLKATQAITRDKQEMLKIFRMACFNVYAHNRDDHSKNFSFLMDDSGQWRVAPAYDLTFSFGPAGEHATMVNGEGQKPAMRQLLELAQNANIPSYDAQKSIEQVLKITQQWPHYANQAGVSHQNQELIEKKLQSLR